ncbi:hypothetical protein KM043_016342 [Ampulex compressa]|nr:hypothetical protein KM043_016342 [Ampulex compressa]
MAKGSFQVRFYRLMETRGKDARSIWTEEEGCGTIWTSPEIGESRSKRESEQDGRKEIRVHRPERLTRLRHAPLPRCQGMTILHRSFFQQRMTRHFAPPLLLQIWASDFCPYSLELSDYEGDIENLSAFKTTIGCTS